MAKFVLQKPLRDPPKKAMTSLDIVLVMAIGTLDKRLSIKIRTFLALMMTKDSFSKTYEKRWVELMCFVAPLFKDKSLFWVEYFFLLSKATNKNGRKLIHPVIFLRIQEVLVETGQFADSFGKKPVYRVYAQYPGDKRMSSVIFYLTGYHPIKELYIKDKHLAFLLKYFLEKNKVLESDLRVHIKEIWTKGGDSAIFFREINDEKNRAPIPSAKEDLLSTVVSPIEKACAQL